MNMLVFLIRALYRSNTALVQVYGMCPTYNILVLSKSTMVLNLSTPYQVPVQAPVPGLAWDLSSILSLALAWV